MCLGAFPTSPIESLYVEANEPSLRNRRIKLSLQYIIKLRSNTKHPSYNCVFNPKFETKYNEKTKVIKPLGLRLQKHIKDSKMDLNVIFELHIPRIPYW